MANMLGVEVPSIDITGFFSGSWIYVFIISAVGILLVAAIVIMLFLITYNKRVVLFENIAGQGYQPTMRSRARLVKLGVGGEEIMKTLFGGKFFTAYGKKMGKNTYWFARGQDGYFYNILLGDLDAKMGMLDIEPIDRDVRMFHVALDRLSHQTYGKQKFLEKYGIHLLLFVFLIVLILGIWFIVGKIGEATAPLAQNYELSMKLTTAQDNLVGKIDSLIRSMRKLPDSAIINDTISSGLVPA